MRLALFDIDGTLLQCRSERLFWRYLFAHRRQSLEQLALFIGFALRYWRRYGRDTLKKDKAYLAGLGVEELAQLAREFVPARLTAYLYSPVLTRLERHLADGDVVALLSGTLQPIARALADQLGVAYVCATVCSERKGRCTAAPPQLHAYGPVKRQLAEKLASRFGVAAADVVAYGNARNDIALLEFAGRAVAVRPDRGLRAAALRRGWEIVP